MRTPLLRWLSLRIRITCITILVISSVLPPFIPKTALSQGDNAVTSPQFLLVEEGFLMKTSTIGQQASRLAFGNVILHTVLNNESIAAVAKRYNISEETIRSTNNISEGTGVLEGQELLILPVDGTLHIVRQGQTLSRISELYTIPQEAITRQNSLKGGFIVVGQQLIIPGGKAIGGTVPAIAAIQENINGGSLTFTDRLPSKDIQLRLRKAEENNARPGNVTSGQSIPDVPVQATPGILQMPCNNCFYTQGYHPGHYAVDIQTRGGGPVFASEAGTIIRADDGGWNGGYGSVIEIDHGNGLVTLYAHNKELYVAVGDEVQRGQTIAWMGNTGLVYGATGIHTHYEVIVNGVKKNPKLYLE